jgi:hypothetical protein
LASALVSAIIGDDELSAMLDDARIVESQLINEVVKSGPKMMDNGADTDRRRQIDAWNIFAQDSGGLKCMYSLIEKYRIAIGGRTALVSPYIGVNDIFTL